MRYFGRIAVSRLTLAPSLGPRPLPRIIDDHPTPFLGVRGVRCITPESHALDDDFAWNGSAEIQALAHGLGRGQQAID